MNVHRVALASSLAAALFVLPGCGDAGVRMDAGADGARQSCMDATDCDDGMFCNGAETCQVGAPGADAFGCLPAGDPPCALDAVCEESRDRCVGDCETMPDFDDDGTDRVACGGTDCDDTDANRFVGNVEVCDLAGHDEDCDSATLGGRDIDSDGYVDAACCNPDGAGGTECGDDCDDLSPSARPGSVEVCDSVDNDCDGDFDEGVAFPGFVDADRDYSGDVSMPIVACLGSPGFATTAGDCDDTDPHASNLQVEVCDGVDNDCDGGTDENPRPTPWYLDDDSDQFAEPELNPTVACVPPTAMHVLLPLDCDDSTALRGPLAPELCNALDDNCNGAADFVVSAFNYEDDDRDPTSRPGAEERLDGRDNDCDGSVDENVMPALFFRDLDGDLYGDATMFVVAASVPTGYVARAGDCADNDVRRFPGNVERCDVLDNDCDQRVDEHAIDPGTFYRDADEDGFGAEDRVWRACEAPEGYVSVSGDCNDDDPSPSGGVTSWYRDHDGDTFGNRAVASVGCEAPAGFVADATDCNDLDPATNPGATPLCHPRDRDCDGTVDAMEVGCSATACNTDNGGCDQEPVATCSTVGMGTSCACPVGFMGNGVGSCGCLSETEYLTGLSATGGTLTPAFAVGQRHYTLVMDAAATSAEFTPSIGAPADVTLRIAGATHASGAAFDLGTVALRTLSHFDVVLLATHADGCVQETTITVTRSQYLRGTTGGGDNEADVVSVSGDGNRIALGDRLDGDNAPGINGTSTGGLYAVGAVFLFQRSGSTWQLEATFRASTLVSQDRFGASVALSYDGSTMVVGADNRDVGAFDAGVAFVFHHDGNAWVQQAVLNNPAPSTNDYVGTSITVSNDGDTFAVGGPTEDSSATGVGAPVADNSSTDSGVVYVYTRSGSMWSTATRIKAPVNGPGDQFGSAVRLSGDGMTLAVGAPLEDGSASGVNGAFDELQPNSGCVYVYTRSGMTWSYHSYIKAQNPGMGDSFGQTSALGLDDLGRTLVVGVRFADLVGTDSGAAYVYTFDGTDWGFETTLVAGNADAGDRFGVGASISGDGQHIGVTAPYEDSRSADDPFSNTEVDAGAAYVFDRVDQAWVEALFLKASYPYAGFFFGYRYISLSSDGAVIAVTSLDWGSGAGPRTNGDRSDRSRSDSPGAAYVFER
ncbi:MAG: hypothetical protein IPN77_25885 [Sandaracinaceae bacterium]|nr:hypothetical protein [Sandaracinaceae bacterium]